MQIEYKTLDHIGFPGYRVGSDGSIWSWKCKAGTKKKRWKQLIPWMARGYKVIGLNIDQKRHYRYIHRLVLESFVGPCPNGYEGCHKNSNPTDNDLKNLRWDTPKNNCRDRTDRGLHIQKTGRGESHGMAKLTKLQVIEIRELFTTGNYTKKKLANMFNTSHVNACDIINRNTWKEV